MPRPHPPRPTSAPLFDRLLELAAPLASLLWARLGVAARGWRIRAVDLIEGGDASRVDIKSLTATTLRRLRVALRWARDHDTVPPGSVDRAQHRNEERRLHAERVREQRQRWREEKEAARKERERKYSEKSSIYLG